MFIPIGDGPNQMDRPAVAVKGLLIGISVVFILQILSPDPVRIIREYGLVPRLVIAQPVTLLTGMFLHANVIHLFANLLFLWIFGDNVEAAFGSFRFLLFFLFAGIASGLIHVMVEWNSPVPCIGASGAIAGVIGTYMILFPRNVVMVMLWPFPLIVIPLPAALFLGFWFAGQLGMLLLLSGKSDLTGVAYTAHVGGFVVGLIVAVLVRAKRKRGSE